MNESDGKTPEEAQGPKGTQESQEPREPQGPDHDDQDLAALFEAEATAPPELLSARILAAAHEAVEHEPKTSADESITPDKHIQRWKHAGRWMAMAASVLLAILVTPLLLRAPESVMEADAVDTSRMKAVQQSLDSNTAATVAPMDIQASDSRLQPQQEAAPMALSPTPEARSPAPMVQELQTQKRSVQVDRAAAADDFQGMAGEDALNDSEPFQEEESLSADREGSTETMFRNSPESWVTHIRQLQEDGNFDEAVAEYEVFRERYPDHEPDFTGPLRR